MGVRCLLLASALLLSGCRKTCVVDGVTFQLGESFLSPTSCNTCTCEPEGAMCTLMGCPQQRRPPRSLGFHRTRRPIEASESIRRVRWAGADLPLTYAGEQSFRQSPRRRLKLEEPSSPVRGLAFHPDGRLGITAGWGRWGSWRIGLYSPDGAWTPLAALESAKRAGPVDEAMGRFSFFTGALDFDEAGGCIFTLGDTQPNGIYRIAARQPGTIEKLFTIDPARALQVPPFDRGHAYLTQDEAIWRYPLSGGGAPEEWLRLEGQHLTRSLIVGPEDVLVIVRPGRELVGNTLIHLDRRSRSFAVLPGYALQTGLLALSADGTQILHYEQPSLTEVHLGEISWWGPWWRERRAELRRALDERELPFRGTPRAQRSRAGRPTKDR